MLVLSRKDGEVVVIAPGTPHECRITVYLLGEGTRANQVRLGFTADRSVEIVREELLEEGSRK